MTWPLLLPALSASNGLRLSSVDTPRTSVSISSRHASAPSWPKLARRCRKQLFSRSIQLRGLRLPILH